MPDNERVLTVVREWVIRAENDLTTAAHTLELGRKCPTDTTCFHAQQCVEKDLKAFLVWKGIDFPKTHDIEALMALLPRRTRPELTDRTASQTYGLRHRGALSRMGSNTAYRGPTCSCYCPSHPQTGARVSAATGFATNA